MATQLKVVALVSGGKDSFFSAAHCIANGHRVVALANLHPLSDAPEDIDSYMYQTVGHDVVPLYEVATGLPLYRQRITGVAVDDSQAYAGLRDANDETEDLVPLLAKVKVAHPEVNAVCSGAILSSYQRTRLESVAIRLGLASLAFLWQYPLLPSPSHTSLLEDMMAAGIEARIIKVASGGLDDTHLWINVASQDAISRLERDMGMFGDIELGTVLGEGGEFETLTLDGPAPFWKKRIEMKYEVVQGKGGTASVRSTNTWLRDKPCTSSVGPRIPGLWDEDSETLLRAMEQEGANPLILPQHRLRPTSAVGSRGLKVAVLSSGDDLCVSNISSVEAATVEGQLARIISSLSEQMRRFDLSLDDVSQTTMVLRNMSDFASLNMAYGKLLHRPNPPSRITVACGDCLPAKVLLSLSVIVSRQPSTSRRGLHVQSRSYWAPANIGPYSQAISYPLLNAHANEQPSRLVYIAGQIPLIPASMQLCKEPFVTQAVLAFQHLKRIGRATSVQCWVGAVAYITANDLSQASERARLAITTWERAHEPPEKQEDFSEGDDFDVGDAQLHRPWARQNRPSKIATMKLLDPIPEYERVLYQPEQPQWAPCIVAEVVELPRSSPIEWASQGLSLGRTEHGDKAKAVFSNDEGLTCAVDGLSGVGFGSASIGVDEDTAPLKRAIDELSRAARLLQLEAYVVGETLGEDVVWLEGIGAHIIPCKTLWSKAGPLSLAVRWRQTPAHNSPAVVFEKT